MGEDPLRAAFLLTKKEKCGYFFEKERFYQLLSFSLCVYVPVSGAGRWMQEYAASRGLAVLRARMEGTREKCRGVKAFHLAELLFPEKEKNPLI